jgi:phospholipase C
VAAIGRTDQANHQYDVTDFRQALQSPQGHLPAVSFIKPPAAHAHPGYSDPIDEQAFVVNTINAIEEPRYWPSTAIIITHDDSDGWYDQAKLARGCARASCVRVQGRRLIAPRAGHQRGHRAPGSRREVCLGGDTMCW